VDGLDIHWTLTGRHPARNSAPSLIIPRAGRCRSVGTYRFPFNDAAAQRAGPAGRCGTGRSTSLDV